MERKTMVEKSTSEQVVEFFKKDFVSNICIVGGRNNRFREVQKIAKELNKPLHTLNFDDYSLRGLFCEFQKVANNSVIYAIGNRNTNTDIVMLEFLRYGLGRENCLFILGANHETVDNISLSLMDRLRIFDVGEDKDDKDIEFSLQIQNHGLDLN